MFLTRRFKRRTAVAREHTSQSTVETFFATLLALIDRRTRIEQGFSTMKTNDLDEETSSVTTSRLPDERRSGLGKLEESAERSPALSGHRKSRYRRILHDPHRQAVIGFLVIGVFCFGGGLLLPSSRQVLFVLAGIAVFGSLLTFTMTADRRIDAEDGARVYGTFARNCAVLVDELGLAENRVYVPDAEVEPPIVRLFVPDENDALPNTVDAPVIVNADQRGLLLEPTGIRFVEELQRKSTEPLANTPHPLVEQLTDAIVDRFELAANADTVVEAEMEAATITITGATFGAVDRFDHPVASIIAVGLAVGLGRPIWLEVTAGADCGEWLVTCRWDVDDA